MKKLLALVIALVMVLAATSAFADGLLKIGYVQVGHESDWRMANTQNYYDVFTEDAGFELELIDCDNDHALQLAKVREFVQKDFDYIVIDPIQTAGWDDVLKEVQDAGIPCIIADRSVDASPDLYTTAVGTDMTAEGVTAGKWLEEYLAGKAAKILVIEGSTGSSAAIGRAEGFNKVAAEHPEWEILASQDGDFTQNGGQAVMEGVMMNGNHHYTVAVRDPGQNIRTEIFERQSITEKYRRRGVFPSAIGIGPRRRGRTFSR